MPSAAADPQRKSLLVLTIATLAGLAILCGLGFWQLQRLEWKQRIIATMQARLKEPAAILPPRAIWPALATASNEYRKFKITGTFDHAKETLVFRAAGKGQLGPVYHVVTPLQRDDGSVVLVNRGFIPQALRDPAKRSAGQVTGRVSITGFLRLAESRNMFTPDDTPDKGVWYSRDPQAIIQHLKLKQAAPFVLDADTSPNPGGWPRGGVTTVKIPNNHLSYAWTWFGLAATLLAVYSLFVWQMQKRRSGSGRSR